MLGKEIRSWILAAGFIVPLHQDGQWTLLSFNKIPANKVEFSKEALKVQVMSSASPLIYRLPESRTVTEFSWKIKVENFKEKPTESFPEDFPFRLGLVATGEKKMNRFQRLVAADWVKKLFDLSPPDKGLDKIYFYNLTTQARWLNQKRVHPKSELMVETVVATFEGSRSEFRGRLPIPLEISAIWLSLDGDDTTNQYQVAIEELILIPQGK